MNKLLLVLCAISLNLALSAQGYYIEYKMTSTGEHVDVAGSMKAWYQDGNTRSDISLNTGQMGAIQISTLLLKSEPNKIYMLNEKDKTYSEMAATGQQDLEDRPQAEYEVEVIGRETINGYNTTHSRVKVNGKKQMEVWTTKDITGYGDFSKIKSKYTGKENMYKALAAKGAEGMPVRIKAVENGQTIQLDVVKAEKKNNSPSLFSIAGYTKKDGLGVLPGGEALQEMMEQLKNMTPQQREEMMKKLQEQYKQH
ncbi:MAG TPA: DUF4412 domain-containing protein [Chitinophagales bacterium]|nr:DUF4412 domain-containing protein [Chitinophagales bacterium]